MQEFPEQALVGVVLNGTSRGCGTIRPLLLRGVREEDDHDQGLGGKVIRLFKVYYPVRTLVLAGGRDLDRVDFRLCWEPCVSGQDYWLLRLSNGLFIEGGFLKILAVTGIVLLISHGLDLYDSSSTGDQMGPGVPSVVGAGLVALSLAAVGYLYRYFLPGPVFCLGDSALAGLIILTFALFGWRAAYSWLVRQHYFRERVYVLGTGERAQRLGGWAAAAPELGIEVVGWTGNVEGELTRESVAAHLLGLARENGVHRVIVAMPDRRGTLPVKELLDLRLQGVKVEDATNWLEKMSGKIEVEQLYPSWLIFAEGFRFSPFFRLVRRLVNFSVALVGLILSLAAASFHCARGEAGFAGTGVLPAETRWPGGEIFLLLQIPHHASGCGGRYWRDLGHGR